MGSNRKGRFADFNDYNGRARDYALGRLPYLSAAFDHLFEVTGLQPAWTVADIGAGTGHISTHLVEQVAQLYTVEPNREMLAEAETLLGGYASFVAVNATAEETGLPEQSCDLIVVGQALHWFDRETGLTEFRRLLRPHGRLALIWNRVGSTEDEANPMDWMAPGGIVRRSFPATLEQSWERYMQGMRSGAATPLIGSPGYGKFEAKCRAFFDANARGGILETTYSTELAIGKLKSKKQ